MRHYPPPLAQRADGETGNTTPNSRQDPRIREYQVLSRLSIGYRPLSWPLQAWCYQERDLRFAPGGDTIPPLNIVRWVQYSPLS
jgi:hypothetical protein